MFAIKNVSAPICKTCKYLAMDPAIPADYLFARCIRFGEQCRISGDVKYYYADRCRRDYTLCGAEGRYHENKTTEKAI